MPVKLSTMEETLKRVFRKQKAPRSWQWSLTYEGAQVINYFNNLIGYVFLLNWPLPNLSGKVKRPITKKLKCSGPDVLPNS